MRPEVKKMRTAYLAEKLAERGHSVVWWTSAFDHFTKRWIYDRDTEISVKEGLTLVALKGHGYSRNISLSRFRDHRRIAEKFRVMAARRDPPDLILASLPPYDLAYEAILYGKAAKVATVVDIRDRWPDIFLDQVPAAFRPLLRRLLARDFHMTRTAIRWADSRVAVTEDFLRWGLATAGLNRSVADRVFYLGCNRPELPVSKSAKEHFASLENVLNKKFIVLFIGNLSRSYHNPCIVFDAAERMRAFPDIHFVIAGSGALLPDMRKRSAEVPNVTLTGWLNQEEIAYLLSRGKIGLCPATRRVDFPTNKFFSYLSGGLPVVSAFGGEMEGIIAREEVGLNYPPGDVEKFVSSLLRLFQDQTLYARLAQNAKRLFEERFDAAHIYLAYAEHLEKIFLSKQQGKPPALASAPGNDFLNHQKIDK